MAQKENHIALNTGAKIPVIGLGTWQVPPDKVGAAVEYAIGEAGYRHIDCAAIYLNESEIGVALSRVLASRKVKRGEVFITSKLWNTEHAKEDVTRACKITLQNLQLEYLDLYLMHWGIATTFEESNQLNARGEPLNEQGVLDTKKVSIQETWQAMEDLVKTGLVRAIGVANFTSPMLVDLLSYAQILPAMNQIELHPYLQQSRLVDFCRDNGIAVTAYCPLGSPGNMRARGNQPILLDDLKVQEIARRHEKSAAQVLIRWALQRNTVVIPKSVTPERIRENIGVFDFELSPKDMKVLGTLERGYRFVDPWGWWKIPYFN